MHGLNPPNEAWDNATQAGDDRNLLEGLLAVVFAVVGNCYTGQRTVADQALSELTQILRRYSSSILASWGIPSPWSAAEDVVQELFVRLLCRDVVKRYDERRAPRQAFLFGVLRNVLSESIRKIKPISTVALREDFQDPSPSPAEVVAMREVREQVTVALGRLRPIFSDALRWQYGLDEPSVALSALSVSARHARTSRAREALRRHLM